MQQERYEIQDREEKREEERVDGVKEHLYNDKAYDCEIASNLAGRIGCAV